MLRTSTVQLGHDDLNWLLIYSTPPWHGTSHTRCVAAEHIVTICVRYVCR